MKRPIKYVFNVNPLYVYIKKHICPECNQVLKTKHIKRVINYKSEEAKFYDFLIGDSVYQGDIEFRIILFYCPNCGFEIFLDKMKKLEKINKF